MTKGVFLAVLVAIPGVAFASQPVDNSVASLIEGRDYGAAEAALGARVLRSHDDARSLLNLAFLYKSTDRWSAANATYARVLTAPDVAVTTNTGVVMSSHDIARAALGTGTVTVASR